MASPNETAVTETREIPALSLRASFAPDTVDVEKRTVDLIFTTGARVRRGGFWTEPFDEELSLDPKHVRMGRLKSGQAPLLDTHSRWELRSQIGVIESASIDKDGGRVRVRFSKRADVEPIWQDVVDGIIRNVSVGYSVHKFERVQQDGDSAKNGVPLMRAVDWEPAEVSLVPIPADAGAGVRSAHPTLPLGGDPPKNPCLFLTRSQEPTVMADPIKNDAPVTPATTTPAPALDAAREAKVREEEKARINGIRSAAKVAKLDEKFADDLVARNVSLDAARGLILDELAKRDAEIKTEQHTPVTITDDAQDKFQRGAVAWLIERSGTKQTVSEAVRQGHVSKVELDPGEFRGMSLLDLAKESLERRGIKTRGVNRMEVARLALASRAGAYQTPGDFATLFEVALGKILLGSYGITPDTWSRFCGKTTVPDFRASPRYRTGSIGTLDSLNDLGEFKVKTIPDAEKISVLTGTKGNIIGLSRQAIINDDMSALSDLATKAGRAGKLTIEVMVYALLAENSGLGPTMSNSQPFFHSSRANVATSGAISAATLGVDRTFMKKQKDVGTNDYLDLEPVILLVPTELGDTARVINASEYDPDTLANKSQMKPNPVRNRFRDIVDSPRVSDISATRRYLFADPAVAPALVVAFLEGQGEAPVVEMQEGWRNDGVEWKVRLDAKANVFDPRAAITNAGT